MIRCGLENNDAKLKVSYTTPSPKVPSPIKETTIPFLFLRLFETPMPVATGNKEPCVPFEIKPS